MNREEIESKIVEIMLIKFEIENPGLDDNLREKYNFDSIDAIEMLLAIEDMMGIQISQDDKKRAIDIKTINQVCDYIEEMIRIYTQTQNIKFIDNNHKAQ